MPIKNLELFQKFCKNFNLNEQQQDQFVQYFNLLKTWNEMHNLTAIEDDESIILDHFWDSLAITQFVKFDQIASIADVGAGAGFPGIPLKIMFPHIQLILIEVNQKKVAFLEEVKEQLQLSHVEVNDLDWRTFLRKTDYQIDYFVSRASLAIEQLLYAIKPSSKYKDAKIYYWASQNWGPYKKEEPFIKEVYKYTVGSKDRKYICFSN